VTVSKLPESKATMDAKGKQPAGEEILMRLRNVYGSAAYGRASVFRWISEVRCSHGEVRAKDAQGDPIETKLMRRLCQFYKRPKCLTETCCRNFVDFAGHGPYVYVADRLHSENSMLDPHTLACELKRVCLSMCLQLLVKLHAHTHDNGRHLVTGGEG
jgi:hypothetical protein